MAVLNVPVVIIGAGPAGLTLAHLLHLQGIESLVLERASRAHIEQRVRAGILEAPTAALLREIGVGAGLDRDGSAHTGFNIRVDGTTHHLACTARTGQTPMLYPQQRVVADLVAARLDAGGDLRFEATDVRLDDLTTDTPVVRFVHDGELHEVRCQVVAGCDGAHGVSRDAVPAGVCRRAERSAPFAWLGILADARPPLPDGTYCCHPAGFALHSMRGPHTTRQYLQVPLGTEADAWSDEQIWKELQLRSDPDDGFVVEPGPILERLVTPLRGHVVEPMQYGRLFLLGDAAHVLPPTGAKGLNLAVADACVLAHAIGAFRATGTTAHLDGYSAVCLPRVWAAQRFAWMMTTLLHRFDGPDSFGGRLQQAELRALLGSDAAMTAVAQAYVGAPFATPWAW